MSTDAYRQNWAKANPEKIKAYRKKYAETHRPQLKEKYERKRSKQYAFLLEFIREGCVDCGNKDERVIEFDHVPERGVKKFKITDGGNHPWKAFQEELAKCDAVCANCHTIRTSARHVANGGKTWRDAIVST